jgi:tRNA(adenine34) deaminase
VIPTSDQDEFWMREALRLAEEAARMEEVPVGAVLVHMGEAIGTGANAPVRLNDPTAHAEIMAVREAARRLRNYRLENAVLYCTVEPCVMCVGALVHARIKRLVFGTRDLRFGAVRSKFALADSDLLNHRIEITEGVLGSDCAALLQTFFAARR